VQLAAGWLAENLRWDVEEDLSRLIGDACSCNSRRCVYCQDSNGFSKTP
jgi:ubiquinone biosynthesis protein UbiJ